MKRIRALERIPADISQFFDREAQVDVDEDSDDDDEHELGDFLDETLASDSGSITPFRPSLVDSPGDLAEAEAAESLARTLDLRYGSRASQADGSVNPDSSGLGPHFFQRLAFQQTVANQTLFCWTAKTSVRARKMLRLLQDLAGVDVESGVDSESRDTPRLVGAAFIPPHLPDRVFFFTSNLSKIRHLPQFTNFYMYDGDLTTVSNDEWASGTGWMPWASSPIPLSSLVRIRQPGRYAGSLGVVMAISPEFGNESLIVAVVPKVLYPTTSTQSSPSRKRQKVIHGVEGSERHAALKAIDQQNTASPTVPKPTSLKPQARLFDVDRHLMVTGDKLPAIIHAAPSVEVRSGSHGSEVTLSDFFTTSRGLEASKRCFPAIKLSEESTIQMKTAFHLDCRKFLWADKPTLPLHEYAGDLYWKGVLLMPIHRYAFVDRAVITSSKAEFLPFIEAKVYPSIFGPLLSQLHWKRGDKIIEASYYESDDPMYDAIIFKIDEVVMQQGTAWATPIQLLRRDGLQQTHIWLSDLGSDDVGQQQVLSEDLRRTIRDGRQGCSLETHRLHLAPGDYVKILAGKDEGVCGHVVVSDASQLSVLAKGSTSPVVVHRDLVETWEATFSVEKPSHRLAPGHKVIITQGAERDQEGFIEQIHDDGTAFVRIGAKHCNIPTSHLAHLARHTQDAKEGLDLKEPILRNDVVTITDGRRGWVIDPNSNGKVVVRCCLEVLRSDWQAQPTASDPEVADASVSKATHSESASAPECCGPDIAPPKPAAQTVYTEEDYTVDPESVSVALRVRLGDFLKVRRTDVQDRGTVKSISLDGKVQIMTESGVTVAVRLLDLTEIRAGFLSIKHPFVGKWITIKQNGTAAGRSLKGREGFVKSHDWIKNTFVVDVGASSQHTVHATTIWHRTSVDGAVAEIWVCGDLQNGPQQKLVLLPDHSPTRPATPPPSAPLNLSQDMPVAEPSSFDVQPGENSGHIAETRHPIAFLSEPWAIELSKRYHFRMMFGITYEVVAIVGRTALTLIPASYDSSHECIQLAFSDNRAIKKQETIKSRHVAPAPLRKVTKDLEVAVLQGERRGQTFRVHSLNKKRETCKLWVGDRQKCEERFGNICIVVPHKPEHCECAL